MGYRVRIAVSELSWSRFRRVFREKQRSVVEGQVLAVELVGTVLLVAWESLRGTEMTRIGGGEEKQRSRQQHIIGLQT